MMCRVIVTYPVANRPKITATTRKAAGIPVGGLGWGADVSYTVGEQGAVYCCLGLGDQVLAGIELLHDLVEGVASVLRQVRRQAGASPQAVASPASTAPWAVTGPDEPSVDITRSSGANAQSGSTEPTARRAADVARRPGSGIPTAPAGGQLPRPRCAPGTAASPAPRAARVR
jgi:hypothetical protein